MGSFGHAMMFVCTFAALLVVTPFVFLHVSHNYLTVLIHSSTGEDRINWPRDTFYDWFPEGLTILGLLFFCGVLSLAVAVPVALMLPPQWAAAAWMFALWLMVPLCLCSMLAAPSKLLILYPPVLLGMARHKLAVVLVYAINVPFSAVVGWGLWLMAKGNIGGVFVLMLGLPPCLMVHGRSWGRLVWLAMNYEGPRKKKKKRKKKPEGEEEAVAVELEAIDDEADDGYGVKAAVAPASERLVTLTEHYDEQMEYERKLRKRSGHLQPDPLEGPEPPTPETALGRILPFLTYPETAGACFTLGISCGVEAMLVHMVLSLFIGR